MENATFIAFLVLFIFIGISSRQKASDDASDYLLAGKSVSPLFTALSAAATKYSGYMFIGLMGYIYLFGLSAIWILAGFLFGDAISFFTIHQRVNQATRRTGALSFADLISRWHGTEYRKLRATIGCITLIFLTTYAAAQFGAGGKALQVIFGWNASSGAVIGALLITAYCLTGGLRASIWTDVAQSLVMTLALLLLLFSSVQLSGGITPWLEQLTAVSPEHMDLGLERFGSVEALLLFAGGWLFNGIGVAGQPHIMVRFMALDDHRHIRQTGIYYFVWSALFLFLSLAVGLTTRLYISGASSFDAELALPLMAQHLLPEIATGIVLGGVFAATMSTADSQILSCSAVLSEDFKLGHSVLARRLITLAVALGALSISLFASTSVFTLVILAWSALAASIGPVVIVQALGRKLTEPLAITMMVTGLTTVILWRFFGLHTQVYEGFPGIVFSLLIYVIGSARFPRLN